MKTTNKIIETLLGAVLSLLVTTGFTHSAAAQTARIVFQSLAVTGGTPKHPTYTPSQIYSMDPDGMNVMQLTAASTDSQSPSWSPNRLYISFFRDGTCYVMEAIGEANGGRTFPVAPAMATGSCWSPDGTRICFEGTSAVGYGLWLVTLNADTGEVGPPALLRPGRCSWPDWSPDGGRIVFTDDSGGSLSTRVVRVLDLATGSEFAFNSVPSWLAKWRPDGAKIAFSGLTTVTTTKAGKTTTSSYWEVFVANADGSQITQVTNLKSGTLALDWNPDGSALAFHTDYFNGTPSICKMDLASGALTLLYKAGQGPHWTP